MKASFVKYIANAQHYDDVLERVASAKHTRWIGSADIKDVYVKSGADTVPLLAVLDKLVKKGVAIRLLHAKEPGPNYRDDYDKYPELWRDMERSLCSRVHLKSLYSIWKRLMSALPISPAPV
jgi:hypothetical protein